MTQPAHKLVLLDGLRGVAACVVLLFHMGFTHFAHGYLAVDFFFMLSGFVVTLAYQARLDNGGLRRFFSLRFARLYPLYLLGLLLGFLFVVVQHRVGHGHPPVSHAFAMLAFGMMGVPSPPFLQSGDTQLFPLDIALWSLFFEVLANAAHALLLRRRSSRTLGVVLAVAVAALAWQAWAHGGLDLGGRTTTFTGGLARVTFAYVAGMLLCRRWSRSPHPNQQTGPHRGSVARLVPAWLPTLLSAAVLAGVLAVPALGPVREIFPGPMQPSMAGSPQALSLGAAYDFTVVAVLYPCLLLWSARTTVPRRMAWLCTQLGAASYAVYVLHLPLLRFATVILERLHAKPLSALVELGLAALIFLLAVVADRVYDLPVRTRLKAQLAR